MSRLYLFRPIHIRSAPAVHIFLFVCFARAALNVEGYEMAVDAVGQTNRKLLRKFEAPQQEPSTMLEKHIAKTRQKKFAAQSRHLSGATLDKFSVLHGAQRAPPVEADEKQTATDATSSMQGMPSANKTDTATSSVALDTSESAKQENVAKKSKSRKHGKKKKKALASKKLNITMNANTTGNLTEDTLKRPPLDLTSTNTSLKTCTGPAIVCMDTDTDPCTYQDPCDGYQMCQDGVFMPCTRKHGKCELDLVECDGTQLDTLLVARLHAGLKKHKQSQK